MWWITLMIMAAPEASQAGSMEDFWKEFQAKRAQVNVMEARFIQSNITQDETVDSTGKVLYVKPRRIVFRYEEPAASVCLIDDLKVYEYDPDLEQVQIYSLADDPETEALYLGFEAEFARLREAYDITRFDPGKDHPDTTGLLIVPKKAAEAAKEGEEAAPLFERVQVYLRNADFAPVRIHIVNDKESAVDIRFGECAVNRTIAPEDTQIALPDGTKIVEDEVFKETVGPEGLRVPAAIAPGAPQATAQPSAKEGAAP